MIRWFADMETWPSISAICFGGLGAAACGSVNLLEQFHAADRTGSRLVLDDEWVHGACVELLALGRLIGSRVGLFLLPQEPAAARC